MSLLFLFFEGGVLFDESAAFGRFDGGFLLAGGTVSLVGGRGLCRKYLYKFFCKLEPLFT